MFGNLRTVGEKYIEIGLGLVKLILPRRMAGLSRKAEVSGMRCLNCVSYPLVMPIIKWTGGA